MQRVRHADGAERRMLNKCEKLRQHERMQLRKQRRDETTNAMSAFPSGSGVAARLARQTQDSRVSAHRPAWCGTPRHLHRTYHRLDHDGAPPSQVPAEGAQALIELLERIGVDFHLREVRWALEDILRLGSAKYPRSVAQR